MTIPNPHLTAADLDVVIVSYRTPFVLRKCLDSWRQHDPATAGIRVNLIVVDVDPEPGQDTIDDLGVTYLRTATNVGFGGACNRAARLCGAPIVSFWNADTALIDDEAIPRMLRLFAEREEVAIAGPRSIDERGRITHAGIFGSHRSPEIRGFHQPDGPEFHDVRRAISVSGSAYFVRRSAWDRLTECPKYTDEIAPRALGAFLDTPHYYEETWVSYHAFVHRDAQMRPLEVWYCGDAVIRHHWNVSGVTSDDLTAISAPMFARACRMHGLDHNILS